MSLRKIFISSIVIVGTMFSYVYSAPLKVALVIPGNTGDKSFFDSANVGLNEAKKDFGNQIKVRKIEIGYDVTKWEPAYMDIAREDYDLIIGVGYHLGDYAMNATKQFPNKKFVMVDQKYNQYPSNMATYNFAENEGSYLAGYLAIRLSEEKKNKPIIGFIGGIDVPVVNNFLVGYIEGAKKANPNSKIIISYLGNFVDVPKAKEMTLAQYSQGVIVGYGVAGNAGLGQIEAAAEKGNYAIGVDSDQALLLENRNPKQAEAIPTSVVKRVDLAVYNSIDSTLNSKPIYGKDNVLGLKEGGIALAKNKYYESIVPVKIQNEIYDIEKDIILGKIKVGTAYGMPQATLQSMRNSVKP